MKTLRLLLLLAIGGLTFATPALAQGGKRLNLTLPVPVPTPTATPIPTATPKPTATPTPAPTATPTPTPGVRTRTGSFRLSDGAAGTYVETLTTVGRTVTDQFVYTLTVAGTVATDIIGATSTDTTVTTTNTDGSRLVIFTHLGFGTTAAFTSTTTFASPVLATATTTTNLAFYGAAGAVGTGTFVAADGTAGTLVSILTHDFEDAILNTTFTSAIGTVTREVRLTSGNDVRTLTLSPTGTLTVSTLSRFGKLFGFGGIFGH